jgi:hypothetical protein
MTYAQFNAELSKLDDDDWEAISVLFDSNKAHYRRLLNE